SDSSPRDLNQPGSFLESRGGSLSASAQVHERIHSGSSKFVTRIQLKCCRKVAHGFEHEVLDMVDTFTGDISIVVFWVELDSPSCIFQSLIQVAPSSFDERPHSQIVRRLWSKRQRFVDPRERLVKLSHITKNRGPAPKCLMKISLQRERLVELHKRFP